MTVITMSRNELTRLRVLIDVADGRLSVAGATGLIGVGRRQIYRLLQAFRADGADGLISRKRGGPSNRALGSVFRETVLAIVRERYADFGPTLAAEKLSELHGLDLGVETLRQWMIDAGLWVRRTDRLKRIHQPRARRDCLGELVQIDGSEHWWFEDRGPQSTLLVYVDDATSRLMHLKFVETESTFDYFQATREYLEAHGKPVAFYSDKHGVFRVNSPGAVQGDGMTQFGRSLHALNIDILCANTPQAKGRVERANKTLQDRLVVNAGEKMQRRAGVKMHHGGMPEAPHGRVFISVSSLGLVVGQLSCLWLALTSLALLQPIAVAVHFEDVGVVGQA